MKNNGEKFYTTMFNANTLGNALIDERAESRAEA